jgi:hypothetical protein
LKQNGIKHVTSAPYHPATNGAAERTVQTVKNALKKCNSPSALQSLLFGYRTTPHATTGQCPAYLFLKRMPRTRFSLLKPSLQKVVQDKQDSQKRNHDKQSGVPQCFQEGEVVRVKNVLNGGTSPRYVKGIIVKKLGPYRYNVKIGNRCRQVHLEHIRPTGELDTWVILRLGGKLQNFRHEKKSLSEC